MRWSAFMTAALLAGGGCSTSSSSAPCGPGGAAFAADVGTVCAHAVVEGGFSCPAELPQAFELSGGGRICAPDGTGPGDLPLEACHHLGHDDCSEARPVGTLPRDGGGPLLDARLAADGAVPDADGTADAPSSADAGAGAACDQLEATDWSGDSPFGALDATVAGFHAGDCIGRSQAGLTLRTSDGGTLRVAFPYPVDSTSDGRVVEGTFEREAAVTWEPASGSSENTTAMIRVAVTAWVEHPDAPEGHEIDAAVTFLDPRFGSAPIAVGGRFCTWDLLVC